ncbi:MAG: PTS sugar transporter subunit IIA [Balneolales bacterium]|nr:PTS sugar transporter subunit IIA [Balneolales bacterium]
MKVFEILKSGKILLDIEAGNKEELIKRMINEVEDITGPDRIPAIKEAVIQRERIMSTGVGKSIAIPHAKISDIDSHIAVFARLKRPLEFNSVDGQPVSLVFLLIGGLQKAGIHIKLLSKISRLLNHDDFRNQLQIAEDEEAVIELFREEEEHPA